MRNFKKLVGLSLALIFTLTPVTHFDMQGISYAKSQAPVIDLGVDTGNVPYQEGVFTLRQNEALKNETLAEVRKIRSKLWDENVPYKGIYYTDDFDNLRDAAKAYGYTSKEAYVNGLTWSYDLERVAIQRAYEQTITGLSHTRPDGRKGSSAVSKEGFIPRNENLAGSSGIQSPAQAFNQWAFSKSPSEDGPMSEYDFLIQYGGLNTKESGHLHTILDPRYKHIGFAELNYPGGTYNFAVATFDFENPNNNEKSTNLVGDYTLYAGDLSQRVEKASKETANNEKSYSSAFYKSSKTREAYLALTDEQRAELDKMNTDGKAPLTVDEVVKSGKFNLPINRDKDWIYPFMIDRDGDGIVGEAGLTANNKNQNESKQEAKNENKPAPKKETSLPQEARNKLESAVIKAEAQIQAAENMINNYPKTVKNIKGELEKIIADSKNLIKEANKLLNK